ncbi:hypothetical protein CPB84DRAFT_1957754 [Gymnopilus junonius]|uniref:MYND-type domain-containing protein n=1 Tax=Gymnopilus junonius TaxID=109634 RepID=A0A9P5P1G9_GYMJU|nr:hypothetical protein CPB84DRAFT_1957754 [Gymnopilus junonius]
MPALSATPVLITEFGPDAHQVKHQRKENKSRLTCQYCKKPEEQESRHKACRQCKMLYCSRECQKADWPRHKVACIKAPDGHFPHFNKICQTFLANESLLALLEVLIALELNLAITQDPNQRFNVQIFIHFEPFDDLDFLKIINSNVGIDASPMRGMAQIGGISSTELYESSDGLTMLPGHGQPSLSANGQDSLPFVRLQFMRILHSGRCQCMNTGLFISLDSIQASREAQVVTLPLRRGVSETVPISVTAYRDFINEFIRLDWQNRWLLQMDMQQKDKELYRDAGAANSTLPDSLGLFIRDTGMRRIRAIYTPAR